MENNFNIEVKGAKSELIIREGTAPVMPVPRKIDLSGIIECPGDFFEGKKESGFDFELSKCHLVVKRDEGIIRFETNDTEDKHGGYVVTGKLNPSSQVRSLGINNENQIYTAKTLGRKLKMNRALFADRDKSMEIITKLQKFKATVTQELEKEDDLSGNKLYHFEQKVQSQFKMEFALSTPIYQGLDKKTFKVQVRFDVTDGSVTYWLESPELKELQDKDRESIIANQVDRFKNQMAIVYQ